MFDEEQNPIVQVLSEAMGKLKNIVDIDTVMGEPVELPDGSVIIPMTKVAMGFVAGGGEYPTDNKKNKLKINYPFSGGSGAGFSIKPIGFLVNKNGKYELITIAEEPAYKRLVNIMSDLAKTYIKNKASSECEEKGNEEDNEEKEDNELNTNKKTKKGEK